jgi:hypothetical protein
MNIKDNLECSYFDQKKACTMCGTRPAIIKTGKCAPHSVAPYDMNRVDDWVDCYEGCLKHDAMARSRYMARQRTHTESGGTKIQVHVEPSPAPRLERLFLLHQHPKDVRDARMGKLFNEAIGSRGLRHETVSRELYGRGREFLNHRLTGRTPFSFMEVCELMAYLRKHDDFVKKNGSR